MVGGRGRVRHRRVGRRVATAAAAIVKVMVIAVADVVVVATVVVVVMMMATIVVVVVDLADEGFGGCGIDGGTDGCPVLFTGGLVVAGWRRRGRLAQ